MLAGGHHHDRFLPRLTKVVPSSLAAILLVSGVAYVVNSDTGAEVDQPAHPHRR